MENDNEDIIIDYKSEEYNEFMKAIRNLEDFYMILNFLNPLILIMKVMILEMIQTQKIISIRYIDLNLIIILMNLFMTLIQKQNLMREYKRI